MTFLYPCYNLLRVMEYPQLCMLHFWVINIYKSLWLSHPRSSKYEGKILPTMASKIVHMVPPTGKPRNPECQTGRLLSKAFWGLVVVCILWKWTSNVINPYKSGVCSLGVVWHFLNYIRWSKSQKNNENIDLQTKKNHWKRTDCCTTVI